MAHFPPRYRGWKSPRPQQQDLTGVRTIAGQPIPTPNVESTPRRRERTLAERIAGGNVQPRRRRQPSLARVMRQVEPSPLKRAFG